MLIMQEHSRLQAADLASRQETLELGLVHLASITQTFMADMSGHTRLLAQANNITSEMLDTLEATAAATSTIHDAVWGYGERGSWWPYVVCPVVFLVVGSYGLPPSITRNIGLLTAGEMIGVVVSFYIHFRDVAGVFFSFSGLAGNSSVTAF